MWILKVISVVGGSDCPIFLLEELLEDAVLNTRVLENDLCELISLGIIEQTLVKAIKSVEGADGPLSDIDKLLITQGGGNASTSKEEDEQVAYLTYTFINIHCQTACYNMLSFSRRQELHTQIAKWYESKLEIDESDSEDESSEEEEDEEKKADGRKSPATATGKKKHASKAYLKVSKKYACFTIHHYFMASEVETSISICELIGTMELQTWCGQYARKVLTKMPEGISDAVLHRIYPCIRWLQGVSSIINALKRGKISFGTIAAGKIVSKKLDVLRKNAMMKGQGKKEPPSTPLALTAGPRSTLLKKGKGGAEQVKKDDNSTQPKELVGLAGLATEAKRLSASNAAKKRKVRSRPLREARILHPSNVSLTTLRSSQASGKKPKPRGTLRLTQAIGTLSALVGGQKQPDPVENKSERSAPKLANVARKGSAADIRNMVVAEAKRDSKMINMSTAYGKNNKAHKEIKAKTDDEEVTTAATFKGVSWASMMSNTKTRIRQSIRMGLFRAQSGDAGSQESTSMNRLDREGNSLVSRQFSSGKALKLGIAGMTSEKSFSGSGGAPNDEEKDKGVFNRTKTILGLGGLNKDMKVRSSEERSDEALRI